MRPTAHWRAGTDARHLRRQPPIVSHQSGGSKSQEAIHFQGRHPPDACATVASGRDRGLVIAMQFSRQHVLEVLHRLGYTDLADEASRDLPDPVDIDRLQAWAMQHGLSRDELISQIGGSP